MPLERPLTMPSGLKAALDYPSMLQLAAKRGFDFTMTLAVCLSDWPEVCYAVRVTCFLYLEMLGSVDLL